MKWEKINNSYVAVGKIGEFKIIKIGKFYRPEYIGKIKKFVFPSKRSLKLAKEICELNFYWEY